MLKLRFRLIQAGAALLLAGALMAGEHKGLVCSGGQPIPGATVTAIQGASHEPINFGAPKLSFTNFGGLADASPVLCRDQNSAASDGLTLVRESHNGTFGGEFRRVQLNSLMAGDPVTDLPLALEVDHFRISGDRYFVPVAVKTPGSQIALRRKGSGEFAEFDFIGQVRDLKRKLAGSVRDTIRVKLN